MPTEAEIRELCNRLSAEAADAGKLIEAGWQSLRAVAVPIEAGPRQLDQMRMAFFAGAQHLFGSIVGMMEEGDEPTDNDMSRMDKIAAELGAFGEELKLRFRRPGGSA